MDRGVWVMRLKVCLGGYHGHTLSHMAQHLDWFSRHPPLNPPVSCGAGPTMLLQITRILVADVEIEFESTDFREQVAFCVELWFLAWRSLTPAPLAVPLPRLV